MAKHSSHHLRFICVCNKELNQQFCAIIDCIFLTKDCFGYPVVTRLNECCPRCDFGVPDDTSKLVPQVFGRQNITVSATPGTRSCSKTVVKRTCDKLAFRSKGKKFHCDPAEGKRVINFEKRCPLSGFHLGGHSPPPPLEAGCPPLRVASLHTCMQYMYM